MKDFYRDISPHQPITKIYDVEDVRNTRRNVNAHYKHHVKLHLHGLLYNETKKEMTCNICKMYDKSGSFLTGCTNMRFDAVKNTICC